MLQSQAKAAHELGPEFSLEGRYDFVPVHQIELPRDLLLVGGRPLDWEVLLGWNRYGFRRGGPSDMAGLSSASGSALLNRTILLGESVDPRQCP